MPQPLECLESHNIELYYQSGQPFYMVYRFSSSIIFLYLYRFWIILSHIVGTSVITKSTYGNYSSSMQLY